MKNKPDGGQAFPHGNPTHGGDIGMTLRDWFAGMALQGELAGQTQDYMWRDEKSDRDILAKRCYNFADAMLEKRK